MAQPLYFEPADDIPGSDIQGTGMLYLDDGSKREVYDDPDLTSGLPPPPVANDVAAPAAPGSNSQFFGAPDPDAPDPVAPPKPNFQPSFRSGMAGDLPGKGMRSDFKAKAEEAHASPLKSGGTPFSDIAKALPKGGAIPPLNPELPPGVTMGLDGAVSGAGAQTSAPGAQDIPNPELPPGVKMGLDGAIASGNGLELSQVSGRIPEEMASRQALEAKAAQDSELQATLYAREQEVQIQRMAALKRSGELDAEKEARDRGMAEMLDKQARLQREQSEIDNMKIGRSLVDAQGGGAFLTIIGAALLGAMGDQSGFRMMERAIDTHVRTQLDMKDSKLKSLAVKLGSIDQAIAAGKSEMWKAGVEHAENLQRLTRADQYEIQTPAIVAQMNAQHLANRQERERQSLGTPIETRPVPMAGAKPADVQKYGEHAASLSQAQNDAERALRSIGGRYEPGKIVAGVQQPGRIVNREEILKNGIPGVGRWDTFITDLGRLPIIGALPKAADNATTSREGTEVRAALEGLVTAQAIKDNPGRAPTEGDAERAKVKLGLTTERGVVDAIERLLQAQPEAEARNVSAFGPGVAGAYEGRLQQQGQSPAPTQSFGSAVPVTSRKQLEEERAKPTSSLGDLAGELQRAAGQELPPRAIAILTAQAAHETDDGKSAPNNNFFGHKATGNRPAAELETTEGEGAKAVRVKQKFAKYGAAADSVSDHISLLKRKYPKAWEALQSEDESAYVAALKDGGYFTGNESAYLKGIQRRL